MPPVTGLYSGQRVLASICESQSIQLLQPACVLLADRVCFGPGLRLKVLRCCSQSGRAACYQAVLRVQSCAPYGLEAGCGILRPISVGLAVSRVP